MLHSANALDGLSVGAVDGEIGTVRDLYFDDERWVVRYLIADTGGWLGGRKVLISPRSVQAGSWADGVVRVGLTRQQVQDSPSIDTDQPVSRQHEADLAGYYGYPAYWGGVGLWGMGMMPVPWTLGDTDAVAAAQPMAAQLDRAREQADSHLRSSHEVIGYGIEAADGSIGEVEGFFFDDESWAIRYVAVDTSRWWFGKHVLISPAWIDQVSWAERKVFVNVARQAVETSPQYDRSSPILREHEAQLHAHYGRTGYWTAP